MSILSKLLKPKKKSPPKGWRVIGGKDKIPADPNKAKAQQKAQAKPKTKPQKATKRKSSKTGKWIWEHLV